MRRANNATAATKIGRVCRVAMYYFVRQRTSSAAYAKNGRPCAAAAVTRVSRIILRAAARPGTSAAAAAGHVDYGCVCVCVCV